MFELNNRFVFHRTRVVDIQSEIEFLHFMYDFLARNSTVTPSANIFSVIPVLGVNMWPIGLCTLLQFLCWGEKCGFASCASIVDINVKHRSPLLSSSSMNSNWNFISQASDNLELFFFMRLEFTQVTQVWVQYFKSFSRVKSTHDEKL